MLMTIREYVLGFCFNEAMDSVILMCKNRPQWQAGLFNGVGGKVERGESSIEAMCREYEEEAGVFSEPEAWTHCINLNSISWTVHIFKTVNNGMHNFAKTRTDENIFKVELQNLQAYKLVPNAEWIIPMLMDDKVDLLVNIDYDMRQMERMANCRHDWLHEKIETDPETLRMSSTARRVCKKCGLCMGIDLGKATE